MLLMEYDYAIDIEVQREEAFEKGVSQGEHLKAIETAKTALSLNLPLDQIAKISGLSLDEIKSLAK